MNVLNFDEKFTSANGKFETLDFGIDIELHAIPENWKSGKPPVGDENGPGRPAFDVFGAGRRGAVKIGAAWIKEIKRGDNAGKKFLTMTLDDPSFHMSLNLTAWELKAGTYEIKWERPRRAGANAAA
ncbi:DUF736 family protein [Thalassospira sp. TSL5-1]|uniref:DUF736 family protein n=1 Tax=Thalassospira sp. TSL5-1 TaxID=1544451 RepID=UPI000939FB92|nr:DUF736 family protein [Thalassospira sp. TSL5-1]OKH89939.1 hypothetical protein LF95_08640 [Thalassospira sp. TSL5-1]